MKKKSCFLSYKVNQGEPVKKRVVYKLQGFVLRIESRLEDKGHLKRFNFDQKLILKWLFV